MAMEPQSWRYFPQLWERTDILMEAARIWQALPQDLLLKILSMLPIRVLAKMRALSQEWKELLASLDALQRMDLNFAVLSFPGLLVQLDWDTHRNIAVTWVIEYLGADSSDMKIYTPPLPADAVIVDACRSIYCSHRRGDRLDLCIGNLASGSRRPLPRPQLLRWNFIAMDFDATRRHCTILLGQNNIRWGQDAQNSMMMQIYDSEYNAWTNIVPMTVPLDIWPIGKAICSQGKFYWLGHSSMIAFTIAEMRWEKNRLPQVCWCNKLPKVFELGGSDGSVMLIFYSHGCLCTRMWKLKEGPGAPEWCEPNQIWTPESPYVYILGANSSGWTMVFDRELKITICNPRRRLIRHNIFPSLGGLPYPSRIFVSDIESNNVYWP